MPVNTRSTSPTNKSLNRKPLHTSERTQNDLTETLLRKKPYDGVQKSQNSMHERSPSPTSRSPHVTDDEYTEKENDSSFQASNSSKNQSRTDRSRSSPATPNTSGYSQKASPIPRKAPRAAAKQPISVLHNESSQNNYSSALGGILVAIIGFTAIVLYFFTDINSTKTDAPTSSLKQCDGFFQISKQFPSYEQDIFLSLKFGVEDLLNKDPCKPSVFLFVHDAPNDIQDFIEKVVATVQQCLNTSEPLLLSSKDFKTSDMLNDYGYALVKYKTPLAESSVMVVLDIADIPGNVAQAFHTICDTINPLVQRAIILLTLQVSTSQMNATENANEIAEEQLTERWSGLANDKLSPLIARVTDQVFLIRSN